MPRRDFLRSATAILLIGRRRLEGVSSEPKSQVESSKPVGVVFERDAVPILQKTAYEATLTGLNDGACWLLYGNNDRHLLRRISTDGGRTWGVSHPLIAAGGRPILLGGHKAHVTLLQLHSGSLAIVYEGPQSRPGRGGMLLYRMSTDHGETWSAPTAVDPIFAICHNGAARVLRSGRIVIPAFKWISSASGSSSEGESSSLTYSWTFYSDDEGETWRRSLSKLYVSVEQGVLGCYDFEESSLVECKDGTLLMFGRTKLGRFYQSVSKDAGVTWSDPTPTSLAASCAPPFLIRIPATGDILSVWNQVSTQEILSGLARHRLSTAISGDGGSTWRHFRNLESLDNRSYIAPPSVQSVKVYRQPGSFREPTDLKRYPHALGCLRICYPNVAFWKDEALFGYDYGFGGPGELANGSTTKVKLVSLDWLYERV